MGTLYDFHCESCGYHTEVSGGEDFGMISATTTILCENCKKLFDVEISDDAEPRARDSYPLPKVTVPSLASVGASRSLPTMPEQR